jgi:hypothetical protein
MNGVPERYEMPRAAESLNHTVVITNPEFESEFFTRPPEEPDFQP